jgi:hypothetical protein
MTNLIFNNFEFQKECLRINNLIQLLENDFFKNAEVKNTAQFIDNKFNEMNNMILKSHNDVDLDNFDKIRSFAISKGGFINSEYRRVFWKRLLGYSNNSSTANNPNYINLIKLGENKEKKHYYEFSEYINHKAPPIKNPKYDRVISLDVDRSVIHHSKYIKDNLDVCNGHGHDQDMYKYLNNLFRTIIKNNLDTFIKNTINHKKIKYQYYQGFHDISLYILLLYFDNKKVAYSLIQRIIEFYFKDLMYKNYKNEHDTGQQIFENIVNYLKDFINLVDKGISSKLEEEYKGMVPYICLSWVICVFTHQVSDMGLCYRIFDYIFCSPPYAIFLITANVRIRY